MAASEADGEVKKLLEQRGFWTDLKGKVNTILPHVDTVIRLKEEFDATQGKDVSCYKKQVIEATDIQEELINDVEYVMRESPVWGNKIFCNSSTGEISDVKPGAFLLAVDDEECNFESVEAFLEHLNGLGEEEVAVEFNAPIEKWVKKYRKVKKVPEGTPTDYVAWEAWYYRMHTPEKKFNRLTPKTMKKRDNAINDCSEVTEMLTEGDLKNEVQEMLARLGQPFTREELGEYNFTVKKVLGQIQRKERELLAEIKEAKKRAEN